ncbi:hypothetical protein ACHAWT_002626 [Skeletonema menzelii]
MRITLSIAIIATAIFKLVCSFSFQFTSYTSHSKSSARSVSIDINCHHKENDGGDWDDNELRQEAAVALLPVFFPEHTDENNLTPIKPVTAEVALKRLLRKKYSPRQQNHQSNNATTTGGNKSMEKSRGRLAELILGTSVMRLRHFVVAAADAAQGNYATFPLPYPLNYTELSPHFGEKQIICEFTSCSVEEEMRMCDLMVAEHAKYIVSKDSTQQLQSIQSTLMSRSNDPAILLAIEHSIPLFLASSLLSQYGSVTAKQICSLMNEPGPITIRKNAIKFNGTDGELCDWLWENDGVQAFPMKDILKPQNIDMYDFDEMKQYKGNGRVMGQLLSSPAGCICINPPTDGRGRKKLPKSIWSMSSYQKGLFEVQDAGSQCIVRALDLVPPSTSGSMDVLDYCAGNGGKTFAIASAIFNLKMEAETDESKCNIAVANVVSHDVVDERLRQIKGSLSRVGFDLDKSTGIAECKQDNLRCTLKTVSPIELKEFSASDNYMFDVVLVDAPCSSSGVLRRRPSQRWLMSKEETLQYLPDLQLDIIQKAASFVKNNGTLVYATCSLLEEENEEVIRSFEKSQVYIDGGFVPWPFSAEGDGFSRPHEITLLPSEWNDGFFFARYRKALII